MRNRPFIRRLLWLFGVGLILLVLTWLVRSPFEPAPRPQLADCGTGNAQCQRIDRARLVSTGQTVTLPHAASEAMGRSVQYAFDIEVPADAPATATGPDLAVGRSVGRSVGICMPRSGLIQRVAVDGVEVSTHSIQSRPGFLRPKHVRLDAPLAPGPHVLTLEVTAPPGLTPGLGRLWVGRDEVMTETCASLYMAVRDRALNVTWVMAAIGVAALLLWARLREAQALTFGLISLSWVLHLWVVGVPIGVTGDTLWSQLFFGTRVLFVAPMLLYGLQLCGGSDRRWRAWRYGMAGGYLIALGLLPLLPAASYPAWLIGVGWVSLVLTLWVLALLTQRLWLEPTVHRALTVLCFVIVVLAHIVDFQRWVGAAGYDTRAWSYLAVPVLCLVFGARLLQDLVVHSLRYAQDAERLRSEVEAQRAQIAADYERLQQQREELAVLQERRRIVRDMHDGLGGQLLSASARLKSPAPLANDEVAGFFDDALQELRSVLDVLSVEPSQGAEDDDPVSALLGALRWRMAPALAARGIDLQWRCDALPTRFLARDAERMQLLRFWQEAFSNVLKHSQADQVQFTATASSSVTASAQGAEVVMRLTDNGRGFAGGPWPDNLSADRSKQPPGIGLDSMRVRAQAIGAVLGLRTVPGQGTEVELRWAAAPA